MKKIMSVSKGKLVALTLVLGLALGGTVGASSDAILSLINNAMGTGETAVNNQVTAKKNQQVGNLSDFEDALNGVINEYAKKFTNLSQTEQQQVVEELQAYRDQLLENFDSNMGSAYQDTKASINDHTDAVIQDGKEAILAAFEKAVKNKAGQYGIGK